MAKPNKIKAASKNGKVNGKARLAAAVAAATVIPKPQVLPPQQTLPPIPAWMTSRKLTPKQVSGYAQRVLAYWAPQMVPVAIAQLVMMANNGDKDAITMILQLCGLMEGKKASFAITNTIINANTGIGFSRDAMIREFSKQSLTHPVINVKSSAPLPTPED